MVIMKCGPLLLPLLLCTLSILWRASPAPGDVSDVIAVATLDGMSSIGDLQQLLIANDDYCDLVDGSDETKTAACSHITSASFVCSPGTATSFSVPLSRVDDGVCDCCDGSDEKGNKNMAAPCEDKCELDLIGIKQQALAQYTTIKAGLKVKARRNAELSSRRSKEKGLLDSLAEDKKDLAQYALLMHMLLRGEQRAEQLLHWKLMRERESRCAERMSVLGPCEEDLFYPDYYPADRLSQEGYLHKAAEFVSEKKKEKYRKHKNSPSEEQYIAGLSVQERVRLSVCPRTTLLPDRDGRVSD